MSKTKKKIIGMNKAELDLHMIKIGDVVSIKWLDVHAYERIRLDEIEDLKEPDATRCWGAVVRITGNYLFIAHEIGDGEADGVWVEALPYGMIRSCRVMDGIDIRL